MDGRSIARTALLCNAAFSALCGIALLVDGGALARLTLAGSPAVGDLMARALGAALIGFAVLVALIARRRGLTKAAILILTASDVAWVLASLAILGLAGGLFTGAGLAAVALVAMAVMIFAAGQGFGATRMAA